MAPHRPLFLALVLVLVLASHAADDAPPQWPGVPPGIGSVPASGVVQQAPRLPALQGAVNCSVLDHGAVGDNRTEDTAAVQRAIDTCSTVTFPGGHRFLLRPVRLSHSKLHLVFAANATVVAWGDLNTWNSTGGTHLNALFYADPGSLLSGLTISGDPGVASKGLAPSTIDGQGWRWWPYGKTRPRPFLLRVGLAQSLLISGMRFKDSPAFHMELRGDRMTLLGNRVEANIASCGGYSAAPNTDAYNVGGTNLYLQGNFNHNGDDGIPLNVGPGGSTTRNVLALDHHSECGTNSGVVIIGTDFANHTGHLIEDVIFRNFTAVGLNQGAGMKISESYEPVHGLAQNITWELFRVERPRRAAIYINVFQEDAAASACVVPSTPHPGWLSARGLIFRDFQVSQLGDALVGCFNCAPERPCGPIEFQGVVCTDCTSQGYTCHNALHSALGSKPAPCASARRV